MYITRHYLHNYSTTMFVAENMKKCIFFALFSISFFMQYDNRYIIYNFFTIIYNLMVEVYKLFTS